MKEEIQQSQGNTGNHGGGVFAWGGKACEKAQIAAKRPLCQRKTGGGLEKGLATLWRGKRITKKAYAGRGQTTKWEIPINNSNKMINLKQFEVWFITGSQHLYGPETLKQVAVHSQEIAKAFNAAPAIPVKVVFKPVLTTPDAVTALCQEANNAPKCIGLITWCHTFSPSKMWINGLKAACANRWRICTRNTIAIFRGRPLTWIS